MHSINVQSKSFHIFHIFHILSVGRIHKYWTFSSATSLGVSSLANWVLFGCCQNSVEIFMRKTCSCCEYTRCRHQRSFNRAIEQIKTTTLNKLTLVHYEMDKWINLIRGTTPAIIAFFEYMPLNFVSTRTIDPVKIIFYSWNFLWRISFKAVLNKKAGK